MSSTPSLPEEVVARIFEHLEISASSDGWTREAEETRLQQGPEDADANEAHAEDCQDERLLKLRTLANASLASKAFHRIVSPTLYHTVELSTTDQGDKTAYYKLSRFARTLQDRPEAAMSVRALRFKGFTMSVVNPNKDWGLRARGWAGWAERLAGRLLQQLPTLECTRVDMALRIFGGGSPGALVSVIVCMCRRLRTLEMDMVEGRFRDDVLTAAFRLVFAGPPRTDVMPPLQGLEGLKLRRGLHMEDEEREKPHISSLISLPALRKLSASTTEWSLQPSGFLAPEFMLQELHLSGQGVEQAELEVILAKCPKLKTLSISWDTASDMERDINDGIVDTLRASGSSLEKLSLRQIGQRQREDNTAQPMQRLGSLHQLQDLRELSLPLHLMLSTGTGGALVLNAAAAMQDLLPISIEVLEIYDCRSPGLEVRHWLVDLAENVEYPSLHTIRLEASRTTRPVGMVNAWWKRRNFEDWVEFSRDD